LPQTDRGYVDGLDDNRLRPKPLLTGELESVKQGELAS
jgi:hypothetical protein